MGIILRGICLMRPQEIQWMYGGGAGNVAPAVRHIQIAVTSQLPCHSAPCWLVNPDHIVEHKSQVLKYMLLGHLAFVIHRIGLWHSVQPFA